jgi:hypothetical protein
MLRKLIITGALLAASVGPALAADWSVIVPLDEPVLPPEAISSCVVVDRPAEAGEEQIAGPFSSQQAGLNARHRYAACNYPTQNP